MGLAKCFYITINFNTRFFDEDQYILGDAVIGEVLVARASAQKTQDSSVGASALALDPNYPVVDVATALILLAIANGVCTGSRRGGRGRDARESDDRGKVSLEHHFELECLNRV